MLTVFGRSPYTARPLWRCAGLDSASAMDCYLAYLSSAGEKMLKRVLAAQCGVTALIALALSLFGPDLLHSALVGAGISVAGNGYAAWRVFAGGRKEIDSVEVFTLYRAELGKLVIIGVLCGCAFVAIDGLNIAAFLGGLVSGTLASVIAAATHTVELPKQEGKQI